jgi:CRP-like cAMP-binding protein
MRNHIKNPKALETFRNTIEKTVSIPNDEWEYVIQRLSDRTFEKNDFLVRAGDIANNFFFIIKGLVRFFYSTESGKEFNKHFAMDNNFAGSFHSIILNEPCGFFIQALERTETLVFPGRLLNELYDRHSCWERLGRKHAENMEMKKELREKEFLLDSLKIRYRRFLKEYPGLTDRIPQYHIASYLGVTEVALSRIRKNGKINQG